MDSLEPEGRPRKFLEVPKSPWIKGASISWSRCIAKVYIKRENAKFWGSHQKPRIFLPLGLHLQAGGLIYSTTKSKEEDGIRGAAPWGIHNPREAPPCSTTAGRGGGYFLFFIALAASPAPSIALSIVYTVISWQK